MHLLLDKRDGEDHGLREQRDLDEGEEEGVLENSCSDSERIVPEFHHYLIHFTSVTSHSPTSSTCPTTAGMEERIRNQFEELEKAARLLRLSEDSHVENESSFFQNLFSFDKAHDAYEEQKTTITKALSDFYTTYPYLTHALIFFIFLTVIPLLRLRKRKRNTTRRPLPPNVIASTHHQKVPSQYPPGMGIDIVEAKWRALGKEPCPIFAPKVKVAEQPRIRRNLWDFPEDSLYKGSVTIDTNFGKPEGA
ncbi:predicted protein [Pyrenophora tritici-repentis Pt-1C-BFP]|uniref:Uncharacterized protein n=2 Tax=Pyrenophora tritici-repentis TaxID=45151 RepID=B2W2C8_PYRTR|nr:uncharacterized protein PTRG_03576 [Pyrenophora tritici-repentis Pt-1C-BFP]EDU46414.1 predicted protein [Pyrenophora tritici-repentis Pt-1C-BFP]